mgnify:FL=1
MIDDKKIENILIDDIIPNRFQPRLKFDEEALNNLANSIKIHGIIQPLVLRKINDKYEIIAGERRYKAAQIVGLKQVPAIIIEADDNTSAELAVIENLQRKDLSAIEEAKSFKKLLDRGYLTQEELSKKLGVSQSSISNKLRLLNLPDEVQNALLENRISERHARSLLSLKNSADQINMLDKIINNRLTVKQTDNEINKILKNNNSNNNAIESTPIENISDFFTSTNNNTLENTTEDNLNNEANESDFKEEDNKIVELQNNNNEFNLEDLLKVEEPKSENKEDFTDIKEEKTNDVIINNIDTSQKEEKLEDFNQPKINENTNINQNQINPFQEDINEQSLTMENELPKEEDKKQNDNQKGGKDLISVINNTRNAIKNIEKSGFKVDTEEFDFEDMYQIIIKIEK